MSRNIPIIRLYDNLLVSIQTELSDKLVHELKDGICEEIQRHDPKGLILEVSGVDILDSYIARSIRDISQVVRLMGVKAVIVGLDPSMAITLVEMGLTLTAMETALTIETALDMLRREYFYEEEDEEDGQDAVDDDELIDSILEEIS